MYFILSIDCDNDAFCNGNIHNEVRRILIDTADRVQELAFTADRMPLRDCNGNSVGYARFGETIQPRRRVSK